eukprot:CAMPEP_0170456592 /NCGR_PEP_ID=MMETSP0123-20130129/4174_1 /TAXON_ID=182087 /ORGANISM="Favella ehrenbergii, Strain Fehren 1" /LENGTH=217 /DNA_ID=CAMNT_0010720119 /DNA_START=759 /DNA_END=1414 /DNA_ORIENTATION=-
MDDSDPSEEDYDNASVSDRSRRNSLPSSNNHDDSGRLFTGALKLRGNSVERKSLNSAGGGPQHHRPEANIPLGKPVAFLPPNVARVDHEQSSMSDTEEAELNEFCETSSWETSSAVSENAADRTPSRVQIVYQPLAETRVRTATLTKRDERKTATGSLGGLRVRRVQAYVARTAARDQRDGARTAPGFLDFAQHSLATNSASEEDQAEEDGRGHVQN